MSIRNPAYDTLKAQAIKDQTDNPFIARSGTNGNGYEATTQTLEIPGHRPGSGIFSFRSKFLRNSGAQGLGGVLIVGR
jgi:hypothetical protein